MKKITRPDVDEYFLKIASVVAERSTCRRHHVGAVAARNNIYWLPAITVLQPDLRIALSLVA